MSSGHQLAQDQVNDGAGAPAGDSVPAAIASLIDAVRGGRSAEFAGSFSGDARAAFWNGEGQETAPRTVLHGAATIGGALERIAGEPRLLVCVRDGSDCIVEGTVSIGDDPLATFLASFQIGADGLIGRLLLYHCPPVDPSVSWQAPTGESPGDAHAVLDRYFEHLQASRFREATECFSADCLYAHPPYGPGLARVAFRGRAELLAGFEKRGPRNWQHEILSCVQRGRDCLLEGVVPSVPGGGSFISSLTLDSDGLIQRYQSVYCSPAIPRL